MFQAQNLIGLAGLICYTIICIPLSKAPHQINWRPVLMGYFTQLILGILVLRTTAGYNAFKVDFYNYNFTSHFVPMTVLKTNILFVHIISSPTK